MAKSKTKQIPIELYNVLIDVARSNHDDVTLDTIREMMRDYLLSKAG